MATVSEHPSYDWSKPECFTWCLVDSLDQAVVAQSVVRVCFSEKPGEYLEGAREALREMAKIVQYTPGKKVV